MLTNALYAYARRMYCMLMLNAHTRHELSETGDPSDALACVGLLSFIYCSRQEVRYASDSARLPGVSGYKPDFEPPDFACAAHGRTEGT